MTKETTTKPATVELELDSYSRTFGEALRFLNSVSKTELQLSICSYSGLAYVSFQLEDRYLFVWKAMKAIAFTSDREDTDLSFEATLDLKNPASTAKYLALEELMLSVKD